MQKGLEGPYEEHLRGLGLLSLEVTEGRLTGVCSFCLRDSTNLCSL